MDKKIFSKTNLSVLGGMLVIVIGFFIINVILDFEETVCGVVFDVEGNSYKTVEIGEQCWFAENLAVTSYRNGEKISEAISHTHADEAWNTGEPAYTWYNYGDFAEKEKEYVEEYGYFYNFHVLDYHKEKEDEGYKLCPEGWRVPVHDDWTELERFVCEDQKNENCEHYFLFDERTSGYRGTDEGVKLKSEDFIGSYQGADEYGFNAIPGGLRYESGVFSPLEYYAAWWSSTEAEGRVWIRELYDAYSEIGRERVDKGRGHHVRCIKE